MIASFLELQKEQTFVGSKAYVLAMMSQAGLPVPAGMILSHLPETEQDWNRIETWWSEQKKAPLAVRSSGRAGGRVGTHPRRPAHAALAGPRPSA